MRLAVLSALMTFGVCSAHAADDALRWKFPPGERLHYTRSDQRLTRRAGEEESLLRVTDMTLTVVSVEPAFGARLALSIDRIAYRKKTPTGATEYEASPERITGNPPPAHAASLRELVDVNFSFQATARGEVNDVRVSARAGGVRGRPLPAATTQRVRHLLPLFPLPAGAVAPGTSWFGQLEYSEPVLGPCRLSTTYRYVGAQELDGRPVERVAFESAPEFPEARADKARPVVQACDWRGTIAFDNAVGRLVSRKDDVTLRLAVPAGDKTVEEEVRSTVTVALRPAGGN